MEKNNNLFFGLIILSLSILLSVFFINTTYITNDNLNVSVRNIQDVNFNISYKNYVDTQDIIFNDSMTYYVDTNFLSLFGGIMYGDINLNDNTIQNAKSINTETYVSNIDELNQALQDVQTGGNRYIKLEPNTYQVNQTLELFSGVTLMGDSIRNVLFNCSAVDTCFKGIDGVRTYNIRLENVKIEGNNSDGSIAIDFTNMSVSHFENIDLYNFDIGIYGNGLNYYNKFIGVSPYNNNIGYYLTNETNQNMFIGGRTKNNGNELFIIDSNSNSFMGVSFESVGADFYVNSHSNSFMNCRYEMITGSNFNLTYDSSQNTVVGARQSGITFNNKGTNNIQIGRDFQIGIKDNNANGLKIQKRGGGMNSSLPTLSLQEEYSASGNPLNLELINARFTGDFITGYLGNSTNKVKVFNIDTYGAYQNYDSNGNFEIAGDFKINSSREFCLDNNLNCLSTLNYKKIEISDPLSQSQLVLYGGANSQVYQSLIHVRGNDDYRSQGIIIQENETSNTHQWFLGMPYTNGNFQIGHATKEYSGSGTDGDRTTQSYLTIDRNSANVQVTSITASDFLKITPRATPPTAQEGVFYYDSDLHEPCYYNSTQWVGITSGGICS